MKMSFRVNGTRSGAPTPTASPPPGLGEAARPKRFGLRVNRGLSAGTMDGRPWEPALDAPTDPTADIPATHAWRRT